MSDTSWMVYDYPEPPAEKKRPVCPWCKGEMSDKIFFVEQEFVCEECFDQYVKGFDRDDLAAEMGIAVLNLEDYEHEHL